MTDQGTNAERKPRLIQIFIDQQKFQLEARPYTAGELLKLAGDDPAETTLAVKHDHGIEKLADLDKPISIKDGEHFVVFHNKPTPVS